MIYAYMRLWRKASSVFNFPSIYCKYISYCLIYYKCEIAKSSNIVTNYRGIWIQEEKELLQEVAGMGELMEPWHTKQIELLDRHLHLLHLYSQAKENLAAYKGKYTDIYIYL